MKHAPEPWNMTDTTPIILHGKDLRGLAHVVGKTMGNDEAELANENARRIVACVNFCAGFETEKLEASSLKNQVEKERKLAYELGKSWGNQSQTPVDLANDRDLALMVLKDLIFTARTSVGVSGSDSALMKACEDAEIAYNKIMPPAYFIGTENGI